MSILMQLEELKIHRRQVERKLAGLSNQEDIADTERVLNELNSNISALEATLPKIEEVAIPPIENKEPAWKLRPVDSMELLGIPKKEKQVEPVKKKKSK